MPTGTATPLICPTCLRKHDDTAPSDSHQPLLRHERQWRCAQGHAFDIARQGYVNLLTGQRKHDGDTVDMLDARHRVLSAGVFDPLDFMISSWCAQRFQTNRAHALAQEPLTIVDAGAGTGHHSRSITAHLASPIVGAELQLVTFDIASAAARRSSRLAQPTTITAVADVWDPWPLATGCADVVLSIFAPRNLRESARVLKPSGQLVVAFPEHQHLAELRAITGALSVPVDKDAQVTAAAHAWFTPELRQHLRYTVALDHALATDMLLMGPSAFHLSRNIVNATLENEPEPIDTTIDIVVLALSPSD